MPDFSLATLMSPNPEQVLSPLLNDDVNCRRGPRRCCLAPNVGRPLSLLAPPQLAVEQLLQTGLLPPSSSPSPSPTHGCLLLQPTWFVLHRRARLAVAPSIASCFAVGSEELDRWCCTSTIVAIMADLGS